MSKSITVREKINLSEPIVESFLLTDDEIELILNKWMNLLHEHHIHVVFNQSPIHIRDQYAFISTSFMNLALPPHPNGLNFCFMYDHVETTSTKDDVHDMVHQLLEDVFKHQEPRSLTCLNRRLHFNEYENLSEPEFNYLVKSYTENKPAISQCKISILERKYGPNFLSMHGKYQLGYAHDNHCDVRHGSWTVSLSNSQGNWSVEGLYIDGF
jgi:hypothetical protein